MKVKRAARAWLPHLPVLSEPTTKGETGIRLKIRGHPQAICRLLISDAWGGLPEIESFVEGVCLSVGCEGGSG